VDVHCTVRTIKDHIHVKALGRSTVSRAIPKTEVRKKQPSQLAAKQQGQACWRTAQTALGNAKNQQLLC
jgi:hypothetical protein